MLTSVGQKKRVGEIELPLPSKSTMDYSIYDKIEALTHVGK